MSDNEKKNNDSFITEEYEQQLITEKIVNKRRIKWIRRIITLLFVIVCAAAFGLVARIVFLLSGDMLAKTIGLEPPESREHVTVNKEKTPTPVTKPEPTKKTATPTSVPAVSSTPAPTLYNTPYVTMTPTPIVTLTPAAEVTKTPDTTEKQDGETPPEVTPGVADDKTIVSIGDGNETITDKPLYDYAVFMREVMYVAKNVQGTIVSIDGINTGTSFLGDSYEIRSNTTGLVLAQDGVDVLILTDYATIGGSDMVEVKFSNEGKIYNAQVYSFDKDIGLAVLGIPLTEFTEEELTDVQFATLCREEDIELGAPVFELGRANGYTDSLSFGIISSNGNILSVKDAELKYFTTDWANYSGASGFVFNLDGYALGMLTHTVKNGDPEEVPCFITLCTLEDEINLLLNGQKLVNFGIYGTNLPEVVKEASGAEHGIYLTQVLPSSPAFNAGLRTGDIIAGANGQALNDMQDFMDLLAGANPAETINITYLRRQADGTKNQSAYVILTGK